MRDGFINVNKPPNMTSHDVVNIVRKVMCTKKVGHGGTLDPFATGVLPIAIGRATKFIEYLSNCDKFYRAEIFFGIETDTGDITGKVINQMNFNMPKYSEIVSILQSFIGVITQTPPKFSAIKINGHKAYELARKNIDFDMPSRQVNINKITLADITDSTLQIDIECSKGTYIRSLAVDIGKKLNILTTLKTLQRIKVGNFLISESFTLDELKKNTYDCIINIDNCLNHLPKFDLPKHRLKAFCSGLSTTVNENLNDEILYRTYVEDKFIGIGKIVKGEFKSVKLYLSQNI